jgi:ubiquinone/menaquinone biosynthesis C-methylase UbiE
MRVGAIPENWWERWLLALGAVPTPLVDTFQALVRVRVILAATHLGVFEALRQGPASASRVAEQLQTHPKATEKLLNALVGIGYLHYRRGHYRLATVARKWLLADSPCSLRDNILYRYLEWEIITQLEEFVRRGQPLEGHERLTVAQWELYQRGMYAVARLLAEEVVRRLPVPRNARRLLDLGGGHGCYAVALCRRYPQLEATILDLPAAQSAATALLAAQGLTGRVHFWATDVRTAELGAECWDLILAAQLLHHLEADTNRELLGRVARALRPGGVLAVLEMLRPPAPEAAGETGALLDLFFAIVSPSGTWSAAELAAWQQQAGLIPHQPLLLRRLPGAALQVASKPAR